MCCKTPKVSIGLPVYNGQKFISEAIESVLAQTFEDFELIICDNASTDQTEKICREYANKDRRIRYYRNEKNLGVAYNFNHTFELSCGEYFKMVAADEGIEPEFMKKAVEVLDNNPSVVNVCARYIQYDEIQNSVRYRSDSDAGNHNAKSPKASQRFRHFFKEMGGNLPIYGLIRYRVLQETKLMGVFIGADDCLLIELVLKGKFVQLPEHLLRLRDHPDAYHCQRTRNNDKEGIAEARWFDPAIKGVIYLPYWRRLWEYFLVVMRSDAKWTEKTSMLTYLFYFFGTKRYRWLGSELIFAVGLGPSYIRFKKIIKKLLSCFNVGIGS